MSPCNPHVPYEDISSRELFFIKSVERYYSRRISSKPFSQSLEIENLEEVNPNISPFKNNLTKDYFVACDFGYGDFIYVDSSKKASSPSIEPMIRSLGTFPKSSWRYDFKIILCSSS